MRSKKKQKIYFLFVVLLVYITLSGSMLTLFSLRTAGHARILIVSNTFIAILSVIGILLYVLNDVFGPLPLVSSLIKKISSSDEKEEKKHIAVLEYQLNEAQKVGAVGSFIVNIKDNAMMLSDELTILLGHPLENKKTTVATFISYILPDDREVFQKKINQGVSSDTFDVTFRVLSTDASVHWLKAYIRVMKTSANTPLQLIGTVKDVTDLEVKDSQLQTKTSELLQKVAELEKARKTMTTLVKELSAERAKDGAILSSIGDGIIATDESQKIVFINPAAELLLGWSLIEVIGKSYDEILPITDEKGEPIPAEKSPIHNVLTSSTAMSTNEYYYARKNKERFPVSITVAPIVLNGKTIGVIDVFRDITHEKDVDRMKTEFISLASHQLRTPLAAIRWFLEILLKGDVGTLTPEQIDVVKNINGSNERMIDLVNSLLNVSRIESGRIMIEPVPTDIKQLVQEVEGEIHPKLLAKKQSFIFTAPDDLEPILLDPKLIRQVYMNLLTNASKYTPEGGEVRVTIMKKENEIISSVADNGYGIPEKDRDKIFTKFFRADNIRKVETDGNGLGLYLVKEIIESSKGSVWFESHTMDEKGLQQGTTFWFTLPKTGMEAKKGEVTLEG